MGRFKQQTVAKAIIGATALLILVASIAGVVLMRERSRVLKRVYRIGADHAPPYYFLRNDGRIEGLAVDVLNEAARRSGVRLQWVRADMIVDEAFRRGLVDLWPALAMTPERRRLLHGTKPWLTNNFCVVSLRRTGLTGPTDPRIQTLAHRHGQYLRNIVNKWFPRARSELKLHREDVLAAVCLGKADAAVVETRFLDSALLTRPEGCATADLRVDVLTTATSDLALVSTKEAESAAELLRDAITELALDGTMSNALERWSAFSSIDARSVYALMASEEHNRSVTFGLFGAILAASVLLWQTLRAYASRRQARRAQADAECAARAKSEFLANMSHEIRTPLNGVIGMTSVVLDGPLTEAKRQDLELVQHSAESLLRIVNDVLDVSKIEAGHMNIECSRFDLRSQLEGIVAIRDRSAASKHIRLTLDYPPSVATSIEGDPLRVRQIVTNFLENALKFTESGDVTIAVDERSRSAVDVRLRISIRDTGIGIAPDKQGKLFSKFTQADASTTRKYGGTGLGLAISRQLAELMHGTVGLDSEPGRGSTFWVELPFTLAPEEAPSPVSPATSPATPEVTSGPVRVLVVEDNMVNQRIFTRSLEKLGYQVDLAVNGVEAVSMWQQSAYNLVLMDCQMPEMDGYEATASIRRLEIDRHTPIVGVTANAMDGDRERCLNAGMDDYIAKPVKFSVLCAVAQRNVR